MFVDASVIEFLEFQVEKKKNNNIMGPLSGHCEITITGFYKIILICFLISLVFNMFFTLMLLEVKLSGI